MIGARGYTRSTLPSELAKCIYWPSIDPTALESDDLRRFERLKWAVQEYLAGNRISSVLADLKLTYEELYRALRRCTTRHSDGLIFGWRALIHGIRVKRYTRIKPIRIRENGHIGGYSGALQLFFKRHKGIKDGLDEYLLTCTPEGGGRESKVTQQSAFAQFEELCKKAGVSPHEWPNCTAQKGRGAIRAYFLKFIDDNYDKLVQTQFGDKAKTKSRTGTGFKSRLLASFPYDVVEVDEHKAHFLGSIGIPTPSGLRYFAITRVILITVTDRRSGVVLGYHVVFRREATAEDVLQAVHNALQPWQRRDFSLSGLQYGEHAGFPSRRLDCLSGCGWASLLLDNALIHLADEVLGRLRDMVGCDVNFGPAGHPERRPIAELVYKQLEAQGFTRVESTTGSNVEDPIRQNPEVKACKTRLHMNAVLDLVELAIAHFNGTISRRTHGSSGLEYLEQIAEDGDLGFLLPRLPRAPTHLAPLNMNIVAANVTGSRRDGVRPRVYALGTYYTSPELAEHWHLIGEAVRLHINPDDVSTVKAYTEDGMELGTIAANEDWGEQSHSLELRKQAMALINAGKLSRRPGETWVQAFLRALREEALSQAKGANHVSRPATRIAEETRKRQKRGREPMAAANDAVVATSSNDSEETNVSVGPQSDIYQGPALIIPFGIKAVN